MILGAGFAGVRSAKDLVKRGRGEVDVVLIDQNTYHTFFPSLYELATFHTEKGKGRRRDFETARAMSAFHLKDLFREEELTLIKGKIENVDFTSREVFLRGNRIISYDYLVISLGSETFYYDIKNLQIFSHGLKSIDDATNVRDEIQEMVYRKAQRDTIYIVIGGGGFTGAELAGELIAYLRRLSRDHTREPSKTKITIVEASSSLLPGANPRAQKYARHRLEKLGVEIFFNTRIEAVEKNCVVVTGGKKIPHDVLIWTAGVKANSVLEKFTGVTFEAKRCLLVNTTLQLPHENVFAVGDNSFCIDPYTGTPLPLTAPVAISQGALAARNILHLIRNEKLEDFMFSFPGFSVPIGGRWAIAQYKGLVICGFLGWFGKELVMLQYFLTILSPWRAISHWLRATVFYMRND